jgi:ribonuclease BN (tRNA processing enzyme)
MGEADGREKLELRVLGTSAAFAGKNEACSSYLVTWRGRHYLLDAGPGSFSALQNYIPYRDLGGVILSHLHADHVSDILSIRYAVYAAQKEGRMIKPLPLFMPRTPRRTFRYIRGAVRGEFCVTRLGGRLELDLEGLRVRFLRTQHPIETYAVKFTVQGGSTDTGGQADAGGSTYPEASVGPGGSPDIEGSVPRALVYTADTGLFPGLVRFCAGVRVLVAEATLQNRDCEIERLGHMTAERAGELARGARVQTLALTHLWPEYEKGLSVQEAKRAFGGTVVLAERGLLLSV